MTQCVVRSSKTVTNLESLTARVTAAEIQGSTNAIANVDTAAQVRDLKTVDTWYSHDINVIWLYVMDCLELLYPKFQAPRAVTRGNVAPLNLHICLLSLMPIQAGQYATHLPPRGSSIFHDMRRSTVARDQAAAMAAQAQRDEQTTQAPAGPSRDPSPGKLWSTCRCQQ
jgi:hypothetical protein